MSLFKTYKGISTMQPINSKPLALKYSIESGASYYYTETTKGEHWLLCPECALDCVEDVDMERHEIHNDSVHAHCDNCPRVIEAVPNPINEFYSNNGIFEVPCDGTKQVFLLVELWSSEGLEYHRTVYLGGEQ